MGNFLGKINFGVSKDRFAVGLDIGTQMIKLLKLKINKDAVELVDFAQEDAQLDPTEVLKKIKQAHNLDLVNVSFCGPQTVIRYVNFLRMSKSELAQALKFEAQKHIPFTLDQVNLDGEILKNDLPDNKMLVLIAALKKELISQRLKVLENSGLRANIIDIDSLALVNAFNFNFPKLEVAENKSVCLLNIGAAESNVNILENGIPRLSRDIHCGGAAFTRKIMDVFSIDFKEAEQIKLQPSEDKLNKVKASIENVLTNLASEIRTSFDYYESQSTANVAKIFLSGGGSKTLGLKEMLGGHLGIPVEIWNPLQQIKMGEKIDSLKLNAFSHQLNVAVGLALR